MEAVFDHVTRDCIAETVEEIGADANQRQVDPGLVAEEVAEGLQREFFSADRFEAFLRHEAAGQRSRRGKGAEDDAEDGVLVLVAAADHLLEVRETQQGNESHGIGADHAVGGEFVLLVVVRRHHAEQRAVGHVDRRVGHHHQQVERISIDA